MKNDLRALLSALTIWIVFISPRTFAGPVYCFKDDDEINVARLVQMTAAMPKGYYWQGYDTKGHGLVLLTSNPKAFPVVNIEKRELDVLRVHTELCEDAPEFIAIVDEIIETPGNKLYQFYRPIDPQRDGLSRIAAGLKKPVVSLNIDKSAFNGQIKNDFYVAVAIHEPFHIFQFGGGFQFPGQASDGVKFWAKHPRDFTQCNQINAWAQAIEGELKTLKQLGVEWYSLSVEKIRERATFALSYRAQLKSEQEKKCYENFAHWERIEGTAHFLDLKTGLLMKSFTKSQIDSSMDGASGEPFYQTGAMYCRILERLFPDIGWQEEISQGKSPDEVLSRLLGIQ